jgi:diguanylate cyclase (GGDEF)-like protein
MTKSVQRTTREYTRLFLAVVAWILYAAVLAVLGDLTNPEWSLILGFIPVILTGWLFQKSPIFVWSGGAVLLHSLFSRPDLLSFSTMPAFALRQLLGFILITLLSRFLRDSITPNTSLLRPSAPDTTREVQTTPTDQLQETLETILNQFFHVLPAQEAELFLTAGDRVTRITSVTSSTEDRAPQAAGGKYLAREALQKKTLQQIPDTHVYPHLKGKREPVYPAAVSVPVQIASEVMGAIVLWFPSAKSFPEDMENTLKLLSDQTALAIQNSKFFQEEQEKRKLAEDLREAYLELTTNLELQKVLDNILEQTLRFVSAEYTCLYLFEEKELKKGRRKCRTHQEEGTFTLPQEDLLIREILQRGDRILVSDMRYYELFRDAQIDLDGAIVGLPLQVREEIIGVIVVYFSRPRSFTEKDLHILNILSDQAALVINNAHIYEAERQQRRMAEALQKTGQIVKSSLDIETVLDRILIQLANVVPYDTANLMLIEGSTALVVRTRGYKRISKQLQQEIKVRGIHLQDFQTFQIMMSSQNPIVVSHTRTDPRWLSTSSASYVRSYAGAPLLGRKGVIGFLSLNKTQSGFYQPDHKEWIAVFASQAAIAIENAQLFASSQKQSRELKSLHQATSSLVSTLDLAELLDTILKASLEALPAAEKGTLTLLDPESDQLKIKALQGYPSDNLKDAPLSNETSYPSMTFQARSPQIFSDIRKEDHLLPDSDHPEFAKIRSAICVPLIPRDQQPLGVLSLDSTQPGAFTRGNLQMLSSFAATATSAIMNAKHYAEVQKLAITDTLTSILNRRGLLRWGAYEFERAKRFGRALSMIFFDLDHFKHINDEFGHAVGDQVLTRLIARCEKAIRVIDIFGRYGGEEFIIILPETSLSEAYEIAERIRKIVASQPFELSSLEIDLTISLGVTEKQPGTESLDELIQIADQAMYRSKQRGRNQTTQIS